MSGAAAPVALDLGLWLYLRCAERLLAVEAGSVERALLLDEVPAPDWPDTFGVTDAPPGCLGVLDVRGAAYGAWDLGTLLGSDPARRAWILLQPAFEGAPLPLAVRTDECVHVGPPPRGPRLTLPPGALGRRSAWRTVFAAARVPALHAPAASVGYELDLAQLWSRDERGITRELLRRAAEAHG